MSDRYIEKNFLYLLALSVLLHLAGLALVTRLETEKPHVKNEPMMVDLSTLPLPTPPVETPQKEIPPPPRQEAPRRPIPFVPPPKQAERIDNIPPLPRQSQAETKPGPPSGVPEGERTTERRGPVAKLPLSPDGLRPRSEASDLFKARKGEAIDLGKLFLNPKKMETLEEGYRKKYEGAEQGDTRMIDTDDPLISVYSHRLLVAANDSLRVVSRRTTSRGAGVGVLQVTINRSGAIENVKMIESTKVAALDNLALTAVRETGYVGPLPKKWPHEKLNLLWIFTSRQMPQDY